MKNKIIKKLIQESLKDARIFVGPGKLTQDELDKLATIDKTKNQKFMVWIAKTWLKNKTSPTHEQFSFDDLRNTIEEFTIFLDKGKTSNKDINAYKSFKDLKGEVDKLNDTGEGLSRKDLENDYDIIVDNSKLLIIRPNTHEASRYVALKYFPYRVCKDGQKDSAWCTTYKSDSHFNSYYYSHGVDFFYIKIKSEELLNKLKTISPKHGNALEVIALARLQDGRMDAYDGKDKQINNKDITQIINILGIN